MHRATPQIRDFAERLVAHEIRENKFPETKILTVFQVDEKLRSHLTSFMGIVGFRALLSRALSLASTDIAWLRALHVKADGSLEGLDEIAAQVNPEEIAKGSVVLLAQFLALMVAFIGENLTMQIVREVWPELSASIPISTQEKDENEK